MADSGGGSSHIHSNDFDRSLQVVKDNLQTIKSIFFVFGFHIVRTKVKTAIKSKNGLAIFTFDVISH
jgi:hypothetical protein